MPDLVLVKHSLPAVDPSLPASQWRLSDEGRRHCVPLAEALRPFHAARVVHSVEPKARETAEIVALSLGLPVDLAEGLHEHSRRNVPYLEAAAFEHAIGRLFAEPDVPVYGEETANQARARFRAAVEAVRASWPGETLIVVAHGTVISLVLEGVAAVQGLDLWRRLGTPSYVAVDYTAGVISQIEDGTSFST